MWTKKTASNFKVVTTHIGFDLSTGKCGLISVIYLIVLIILTINCLFYVITQWENINKRLDGLRGIILCSMAVVYFIAISYNWNDLMILIKIIENGAYKFTYSNTSKQIELKQKLENDISQLNTVWYYCINSYIIIEWGTGIITFVVCLIQRGRKYVTPENLYSMLPIYYPKNYENISAYIFAFLLQSFAYVYLVHNGYVVIVAAFNSMQLIEGELKILTQSLKDSESECYENYGEEKYGLVNIIPSSQTDFNSLKLFLVGFLKHHSNIYRKVKFVTSSTQLVAISLNSGLCLWLCIAIYGLATTEGVMVMLIQAISSTFILVCLYCYGLMGEKITNEDDNLRQTVNAYPWLDKPKWFKTSLLIIMTRLTRKVEIKSLGLIVLNVRNFLLTVRAAYSYYNILCNLV